MWLIGLFAAVALVLAAVGVYGVMSYTVAQRTHEIGVRMALGARRRDVLGMVLRQGMGLALAGIALGALLSIGATRLITGLLFGIGAGDPLTYVAASCVIACCALVAILTPALRATRVDPMTALRCE